MIDLFIQLLGSVDNSYESLILLFGCMVIILFVCTSILQLLASFFKR